MSWNSTSNDSAKYDNFINIKEQWIYTRRKSLENVSSVEKFMHSSLISSLSVEKWMGNLFGEPSWLKKFMSNEILSRDEWENLSGWKISRTLDTLD